jgi:uncharacterized coiled-coil protein SlyX
MGNRTHELEQQVEIRDSTIEVLGNQLHNVQEELDEANAHIDMHHQDMNQAMEADRNSEEEDPEEIESASRLDMAYSGVPLSPMASAASATQG